MGKVIKKFIFFILGLISLELLAFLLVSIFQIYHVEMARYSNFLKIPAPFKKGSFVHRPNAHEKLMGVDIKTNSLGFRDLEERDVSLGNHNLILGDSLTLGWGVNYKDTFAYKIGEHLKVDTFNGGHGNYNLERINLLLKYYLEKKPKPKKVFVFLFINDPEILEPFRGRNIWSYSSLFQLSYALFAPAVFFITRSNSHSFKTYYSSLYKENSESFKKFKSEVQKLHLLVEKFDLNLKVFLLPELHNLDAYPFEKEHRQIRELFENEQIPFYDLIGHFKSFKGSPEDLWVAYDDAHPNARGHKIVFKGVIKILENENEKEKF